MLYLSNALELNTPRHEIKATIETQNPLPASLSLLSLPLLGRLLSYRCPALSYPFRMDARLPTLIPPKSLRSVVFTLRCFVNTENQ